MSASSDGECTICGTAIAGSTARFCACCGSPLPDPAFLGAGAPDRAAWARSAAQPPVHKASPRSRRVKAAYSASPPASPPALGVASAPPGPEPIGRRSESHGTRRRLSSTDFAARYQVDTSTHAVRFGGDTRTGEMEAPAADDMQAALTMRAPRSRTGVRLQVEALTRHDPSVKRISVGTRPSQTSPEWVEAKLRRHRAESRRVLRPDLELLTTTRAAAVSERELPHTEPDADLSVEGVSGADVDDDLLALSGLGRGRAWAIGAAFVAIAATAAVIMLVAV